MLEGPSNQIFETAAQSALEEVDFEASLLRAVDDPDLLNELQKQLERTEADNIRISDETIAALADKCVQAETKQEVLNQLYALPKIGHRFAGEMLNRSIGDLFKKKLNNSFRIGYGRVPATPLEVTHEGVTNAINSFLKIGLFLARKIPPLLPGLYKKAISLLRIPGPHQMGVDADLLNQCINNALNISAINFVAELIEIPGLRDKIDVYPKALETCAKLLLRKQDIAGLCRIFNIPGADLLIRLEPQDVISAAKKILRKGEGQEFLMLIYVLTKYCQSIPIETIIDAVANAQNVNTCLKKLTKRKDTETINMFLAVDWLKEVADKEYLK